MYSTLFQYQDEKNDTFYINICSNFTSPCYLDDAVCEITPNSSTPVHLAYSDNVRVASDGVAGLFLYFTGQICNPANNNQLYNTSINFLCDMTHEGKIVTLSLNHGCDLLVIIKSKYACGNPQSSNPPNVFATLFGIILVFVTVIGIVYAVKRNNCCCFANRHNDYLRIPSGGNENHQNINIVINNENNNNNQPQPPQQQPQPPVTYNHEILQGETPSSGGDRTCAICFDKPVNTVLLDCGHAVICLDCTKKVNACPVCRGSISKVVQIYQI
eukprot:gene9110-11162_t